MKKVVIENIEFQFSEIDDLKLQDIETIINNNRNLFLRISKEIPNDSKKNTEGKNVIYIENFDEFFKNIIYPIFNELNNTMNDTDLLPNLYIETLIREKENHSLSLVQPNSNLDDETLYSIIAWLYFKENGTFEEFIEYIKYRKNVEKIKIWLQNKSRFEAYNLLLKITIDYLKEIDFTILENINILTTETLNEQLNQAMQSEKIQEDKNINLPSISEEQLDILFCEFLKSINAPQTWLEMYNNLKEKNSIIFEKANESFNNSACYKDEENTVIIIQTDGTIDSFYTLVHEFIHYVSMQEKVKVAQFSISELPSIFFEKIASIFLKTKGYASDAVDLMANIRNANNLEICKSLFPIFADINHFLNIGPKNREEEIAFWENYYEKWQQTKEKIYQMSIEEGNPLDSSFLETQKIDIEKAVDSDCDALIDIHIEKGLLVIDGYQYLIGTYLANEILKKVNQNPSIISKMVKLTNQLANFRLMDVLIMFDIEITSKENKGKQSETFSDMSKKSKNKKL